MREQGLLCVVASVALAGAIAATACGQHKDYDLSDAAIDAPPPCLAGIACNVDTSCPDGKHTTVTGTAYAPNGTLPLYNASVFIPTTALDPFPTGVTCDRCNAALSGAPLASAITGPDGKFTLVDAPSGRDFPLVIQLGRWRRQVTIHAVNSCITTQLDDNELTRLPRNRSEGDVPHMAIATGAADPFECLLLKLGLDPTEITAPSGGGRIHFYTATDAPGTDLATPAPRANELYSSLANLEQYDAVLLPCEGGAFDKSSVDGVPLTTDPRPLISQYVDLGGRVFTTHYSYDWLSYAASPYDQLATPGSGNGQWPVGPPDDYNSTIAAPILVNFQKGADFAAWLGFAGATSPPGSLDIAQGRHDITGVDPTYARPWVDYDFNYVNSGPGVMHFTFNTPLDPPLDNTGQPQYCGRVVFSDFHVTASAIDNASLPFPVACNTDPMTDQERRSRSCCLT